MTIPGTNISFKDQRGSFGPQNTEMNIVIILIAIIAIVSFSFLSGKIGNKTLETIAPQAECIKELLLAPETNDAAKKAGTTIAIKEGACKGQELFLKNTPMVIAGKALNLTKIKIPQEEVRLSRDWQMSTADGSVQVTQKKAISFLRVIGAILLVLPLIFAVTHIIMSIKEAYGCCLFTSIIWLVITVVAYSWLFAAGHVIGFARPDGAVSSVTITKELAVFGKTGIFDPEIIEGALAAAPISLDDDSSQFTVFYMGREDEDDKEEKLLWQILFPVDIEKIPMLAPVLETFINETHTPARSDDSSDMKEGQPPSRGEQTGETPAADKK
jgi:hypothetical protein